MRPAVSLFILIFSFLITGNIYATTYSYTDAAGTMHFVDDPAKIPAREREKMHIDSESSQSYSVDELQSIGSDKPVIELHYYPDDKCPQCDEAEDYLKARGFKYVKYEIDNERLRVGGNVFSLKPTIIVGSEKIIGFVMHSTDKRIDKLMGYDSKSADVLSQNAQRRKLKNERDYKIKNEKKEYRLD